MGKKILIIDDNEQDKKILARYLNKAGYSELVMAGTGEEGVSKAEGEKPDLVITDTMLPGIDGFEVCSRIRGANPGAGPKIIVMTGSIDAVDAVKARKSGADDYCAKSSDFSALLEAARRFI